MIKIKEMTLEDIEQIVEIENQSFKVPWKVNDFIETLEYENIVFLAAKDDSNVVGYCGIYMSVDQADIANIAVSLLYRGKGIAQKLVDGVLEIAKERAIKEVFLEVRQSNAKAIGLYKKMGFEQIGIRKSYYSNPKEDALLMMKGI